MGLNLAIVLCTYNGGTFLKEQLKSYSSQLYKGWSLHVYDDGSTDDTKQIIEHYKNEIDNPVYFKSNEKKMGFAQNFLNAIVSTPSTYDYYSLSDQDDIWLEAKIQKGVDYLNTIDVQTPALYCSRTTLVDRDGKPFGTSPLFSKKPSFRNALVQSIAGGNTMVFNQAAHKLICQAGQHIDVVSHDWFIYQLITGAGGRVYYDPHSELLYRQHAGNLIGSNTGITAKFSRLGLLLNGSFKAWNDKNTSALKKNTTLLTEENNKILDEFISARNATFFPRMMGLLGCKVYRQTLSGNIALYLAGLSNKL